MGARPADHPAGRLAAPGANRSAARLLRHAAGQQHRSHHRRTAIAAAARIGGQHRQSRPTRRVAAPPDPRPVPVQPGRQFQSHIPAPVTAPAASRRHARPYCRPVTGSVHPHRRNTDPSPAITTTFRIAEPVLLSCLQHPARHCKGPGQGRDRILGTHTITAITMDLPHALAVVSDAVSDGRCRILGGLVLPGRPHRPGGGFTCAGRHVFQAAPGGFGQDQQGRNYLH
jgi:hypothetical protein